MKKHHPSKVTKLFKLNFSQKDTIALTNQDTLRKTVGILGLLLPPLLFLLLYISSGCSFAMPSISHYYYTRLSGLFVITVSLWGIFLLVYKGHDPIDFYISSIAGVFALCVVMFPTTNIANSPAHPFMKYSVTILKDSPVRSGFHYASAAIFLSCLAYMSIYLFTKTDMPKGKMGRKKRTRNIIYITCGIIMALALITAFLGYIKVLPAVLSDWDQLTFCMETIAVESFGLSWLIKGKSFFKD